MGQVLLEGIEKQYPNGFKAVTDLNLEITDGEFLVMVGPSGCGKSTTLRMIAGLEEITGGTLTIGDRVVNELQPKDRDIAMVFQNYALYPHMTVYDNVAFALKLAKVPKAEIDQRVMAAARTLELDPLLDRKPAQLSGGQRQRVAMGRAIVRSPEVFLLDEPLSNLDAKLRVQMRAEVTRIQAELGVTTFYVTHDQVEAMTMADRVAVIKAGILQQVDPPQKLFDEPDNLFVAAFIGSPSMNLMQGVLVDEGDDDLRLGLGSHTLSIPRETLAKRPRLREYLGKPVAVGLRPKDLNDAALYPDTPPDRRFRSTITNREALGFEVIMHFDLDATPIIEAEALDLPEDMISAELGGYADVKTHHPSRVAARFDPETKARVGDAIEVAVFVEHAHFFDPESGLAIRD